MRTIALLTMSLELGSTTALAQAGKTPYQEFQAIACPRNEHDPTICLVTFPAVPEGKRLVVERVNAGIFFASGGVRRTALFAGNAPIFLPMHPQADPLFVIVNESVLFHLDPGRSPVFQLLVNDQKDAPLIAVTLSGYLVDAEP
jgi:hypothetical protein